MKLAIEKLHARFIVAFPKYSYTGFLWDSEVPVPPIHGFPVGEGLICACDTKELPETSHSSYQQRSNAFYFLTVYNCISFGRILLRLCPIIKQRSTLYLPITDAGRRVTRLCIFKHGNSAVYVEQCQLCSWLYADAEL